METLFFPENKFFLYIQNDAIAKRRVCFECTRNELTRWRSWVGSAVPLLLPMVAKQSFEHEHVVFCALIPTEPRVFNVTVLEHVDLDPFANQRHRDHKAFGPVAA